MRETDLVPQSSRFSYTTVDDFTTFSVAFCTEHTVLHVDALADRKPPPGRLYLR